MSFNIFIAAKKTGNLFLSKLFKVLIIAFLKLVFPILGFCLHLFFYLFFLLDNLFNVCKKLVMSSIELFFIIFQDVIAFLILIAAIYVGELSQLNMVEKIATMCMQWPGQKAKELFVISIIIPCFFIQVWLKIIIKFPNFVINKEVRLSIWIPIVSIRKIAWVIGLATLSSNLCICWLNQAL